MGKDNEIIAYLINRIASTTIKMYTPKEKWAEGLVDYNNLRTFGCIAYSRINDGKLLPRSNKCLFIGYLEGVQGYKL